MDWEPGNDHYRDAVLAGMLMYENNLRNISCCQQRKGGDCDLTMGKIERCCPTVTVCEAVNPIGGVVLTGLIVYSRYESILGIYWRLLTIVILAWGVQYHQGENRDVPSMAAQIRVTVYFNAQVIEKTKKGCSSVQNLTWLYDTKAHRGKGCVGACSSECSELEEDPKRMKNEEVDGAGGPSFIWSVRMMDVRFTVDS